MHAATSYMHPAFTEATACKKHLSLCDAVTVPPQMLDGDSSSGGL